MRDWLVTERVDLWMSERISEWTSEYVHKWMSEWVNEINEWAGVWMKEGMSVDDE